jgi:GT2 family glycosyltransferase
VSLTTAAIVVSHAQPELLKQALVAVVAQTHPAKQLVVVETSENPECAEIALSFGAALVQRPGARLGAAIEAGRLALESQPNWLWVLHDDAFAETWALERLIKTVEISPSVGLVGAKLLEAERPGVIQQLGLTATALGTPFLLVQDEFDQGQHDQVSDTLAVSTAGMLISNRAWQQLDGLRDDVPLFAADVDLGARARIAGYRVIVEPAARIRHHGLSMNAGRSRAWLGSSRWFALRRAQLHLAFTLPKLPVALLLLLLAGPIAVVRALGQLLQKRPQRMLPELLAPLLFWLSFRQSLSARRRISALGSRSALRGLLATPRQLRARRQARLRHLPAPTPGEIPRGLFATGSWWLALVPLAASLQLFPRDVALTGGALLPLSSDFSSVFAATGASSVAVLGGSGVPSDPFNWALLALAAVSPTVPSLALAIFVYAAGAIAFWGAWKLLTFFGESIWVRNLLALGYALSPTLAMSQQQLFVQDLMALSLLPWVLHLVLKTVNAATVSRAWRWLGLAGIAFALLAVSSIALAAAVLVIAVIAGMVRWRRLLIIIWLPLPATLLVFPAISLALITNPLLALRSSWLPESLPTSYELLWLLALPLVVFAAIGLFSSRWPTAIALWLITVTALAVAWLLPVGSAAPLEGLAWLAISAAAYLGVNSLNRSRLLAVTLAVALAPGPALALTAGETIDYRWGEDRVAPALVAAASESGQRLRTLIINSAAGTLNAELVDAGGGYLERRSLFVDALRPESELAAVSAELAARLAVGNDSELDRLLAETAVGFVVLANPDAELESNIDSVPQLAAAGATRWGKLWRVVEAREYDAIQEPQTYRWLQLGLLAGYLLLAVPTPATVRGSYRGGRRS